MATLTLNPHLDTNYGSSHIDLKKKNSQDENMLPLGCDFINFFSKVKVANWTTKQSLKNPMLSILSRSQLSKFAIKHQNVIFTLFFIRIHALNNQNSKICFANKTFQ